MDSSFPFALLPEDVQLQVLLSLEVPDILRCRQVNKALYGLTSITAVEYKVQLDLAGMVDNPYEGSPMIERHRKLLQYQDGWRNAILSFDPDVPPARNFEYRGWTGGVLPYNDVDAQSSRTALHLYRPRSVLRGLQPKKWVVEPDILPERCKIIGCGVDMAQDLLVLSLAPSLGVPNQDMALQLQLLSLRRTVLPHPLASCHILRGPFVRAGNANTRSIQICGDIVAWLIRYRIWELQVWNWKTGTLLLHYRFLLFHGFALLNQSYLLIVPPNQPQSKATLPVYCIHSDPALNSGSKIREGIEDPDFVLKLMQFTKGIQATAYLSHSHETLGVDDVPPFRHNPDLTIFALQLDLGYSRDSLLGTRSSERLLLVASVQEVIRHLNRLRASVHPSEPSTADPRVLEWKEWGPSSTRLVSLRWPIWNRMLPTSGTRCAIGFQAGRGDDRFQYIFILSAHPHAGLEARRMEDEDAEDVARFMSYGDTLSHPNVFRKPVHTMLPIAVTCRKIPRRPEDEAGGPAIMGLFGGGLSFMFQQSDNGPSPGGLLSFYV